jgi:acyl-CoA synthetase (AMP-forming)/AMP-acid ligase II
MIDSRAPAPPPPLVPLVEQLRRQAALQPAQELLRDATHSVTFADADALSERLARRLLGLGLAPGDRLAIMLGNSVRWPLTWLAAQKARLVAVPVNPRYRAADLRHVLEDSGARAMVADPALAEIVAGARADGRCPALEHVVELAPAGADSSELLRLLGGTDAETDLPAELSSEDLVNLQYTSGTTGFPKACMLPDATWVTAAETIGALAELGPDDVLLTAQPFSYADPQWNTALAIVAGIPLVIEPGFSASGFWPAVRRSGATFVYLVGTMPVFLHAQQPSPDERAHRLRLIICSGISAAHHAEYERRWGVPLRELFALTESGVDLAVPLADTASVGTGDLGRPVPGKEMRIVASDGSDVPDGAVGELIMRGGRPMLGYWNQPQATAERIRDGWLHTGDLVVRRDGRTRIVGRLKDMVRRGGENVAAAEVEAVLGEHPEVIAAAVAAVPDADRGEEIRAFVQLVPGAPADPERLLAHARDRLAAFKVPRYVQYVEGFPRTPSERIAKHQLPAALAGSYDAATKEWL